VIALREPRLRLGYQRQRRHPDRNPSPAAVCGIARVCFTHSQPPTGPQVRSAGAGSIAFGCSGGGIDRAVLAR
jgi:hypothetical protein